jgi:opacity protein-like surface antigen
MKNLILVSLVMSSTLLATEPTGYVNMDYVYLKHINNGTSSDFKPTAFQWTVGYNVATWNNISIGLEGSAMLGVISDTKRSVKSSTGGTLVNVQEQLDTLYSLNVKASLPLFLNFSTHLYVGGSRAKIESIADNYANKSVYDSSLSYGAGIKYLIAKDVSVHADYRHYFKNLEAVQIGVGFGF